MMSRQSLMSAEDSENEQRRECGHIGLSPEFDLPLLFLFAETAQPKVSHLLEAEPGQHSPPRTETVIALLSFGFNRLLMLLPERFVNVLTLLHRVFTEPREDVGR